MEVFKDVLRLIDAESITFARLDMEEPDQLPGDPNVVIDDDIAFRRA